MSDLKLTERQTRDDIGLDPREMPKRFYLGGHVYLSEMTRRHLGDPNPVVYSLVAFEGCDLYIGSTCDLWRRLREHRASFPWWAEVAAIRWQACTSEEQARVLERHWIRLLEPMLNIHHSTDPQLARDDWALMRTWSE